MLDVSLLIIDRALKDWIVIFLFFVSFIRKRTVSKIKIKKFNFEETPVLPCLRLGFFSSKVRNKFLFQLPSLIR